MHVSSLRSTFLAVLILSLLVCVTFISVNPFVCSDSKNCETKTWKYLSEVVGLAASQQTSKPRKSKRSTQSLKALRDDNDDWVDPVELAKDYGWMHEPSSTESGMRAYGVFGNTAVRDLSKTRIIFTITTGHSGSVFLYNVLSCAHNLRTTHEAKPAIVSFHLLLLRGRNETYPLRKGEKWDALTEHIVNSTSGFCGVNLGCGYADASHMFIKSWADVFIEWMNIHDPERNKYEVDIIVLRRYMPALLRSFLTDKFSWNPAFDLVTWSAGEYVLDHKHMALLPPLRPHAKDDAVDMVMGYLVDMELQYLKFRSENPQFRYIEVRSEELFTPDGIDRLFLTLELHHLDASCVDTQKTMAPVNPHVGWRCPALAAVDQRVFEARAVRFLRRYKEAGVAIPALPHMRPVQPCRRSQEDRFTGFCEMLVHKYTESEIQRLVEMNPIPNNRPPVDPGCPACEPLAPVMCP